MVWWLGKCCNFLKKWTIAVVMDITAEIPLMFCKGMEEEACWGGGITDGMEGVFHDEPPIGGRHGECCSLYPCLCRWAAVEAGEQ